jgi:hypothetical protein
MKISPKRALYVAVTAMRGDRQSILNMVGGDEECAKEVVNMQSAIAAFLYEAITEKWTKDGIPDAEV